MKHLRFHELLLVSTVEQASRKIKFDESVTLIRGANDTGKSSVMKSIYSTLGAEPPNVHQQWKDAKVVSSLRFSVGDDAYRLIRHDGRFSMFDREDEFIESFTSVTKELSPHLATLFDFHLTLQSRSGDTQATPAFLYLPFYIDQDQGWQKNLNSFTKLNQFSNWRSDVVSFHSGIRPSEYYLAKAELREVVEQESKLRQERQSLQSVLDGIRVRLDAVDFDVDIEAFKTEITQLLERCSELRNEEYSLRQKLTDTFNAKKIIEEQVEITNAALVELRADRMYAAELDGEIVVCPTCHATYENSFIERFEIALDEDGCIQLLSELQEQLRNAKKKWKDLHERVEGASLTKNEMESLLSKKRRNVRLRDVLRREGQKDVSEAIRKDIDDISRRIGQIELKHKTLESKMKEYDRPKRRKEIKGDYKSLMSKLVAQLDVDNIPDSTYSRLDAQINETGSDLPRGILAYYLALTRTIEQHGSSTLCPLVVDSPRQQDQDDVNWVKMLECIRDERPKSQLVLAFIDNMDVDFSGTTIELSTKRHVLSRQGYNRAMDELRPLIDASLDTSR